MEMLLLSEERECGKMKKKKIMFIILCMLTVLAAGTAHATEKERVDPLQIRVELQALTTSDFERILTEPNANYTTPQFGLA